MTFRDVDLAPIARALAHLGDGEDDLVDVFFERQEIVESGTVPSTSGVRVWREQGFALRLVRGGSTWLATRDAVSPELFASAYRQVARVLPPTLPMLRRLQFEDWGEAVAVDELLAFPDEVEGRLRDEGVGFPFELLVARHRRWIQVVGPQLVPDSQAECYFSCRAVMPWGRYGTLLPALDAAAVTSVARSLIERFRSREALPPAAVATVPILLGPSASAVFLHEAVAHSLEADTLALTGVPEAAIGIRLAEYPLGLLDDPSGGPEAVRRSTDDEGVPILRRWLLRDGCVEQPLADRRWAAVTQVLVPGAGRRGHRNLPPGPRSSHLELVAGTSSVDELLALADGGIFATEVDSGRLNPLRGTCSLRVPHARRVTGGELTERLGPFVLEGGVGALLGAVRAVGGDPELAGAGWCAKGGQRLPVWATTPALLLGGITLSPESPL